MYCEKLKNLEDANVARVELDRLISLIKDFEVLSVSLLSPHTHTSRSKGISQSQSEPDVGKGQE